MKLITIKTTLLLLLIFNLVSVESKAEKPTNFIIIYLDDVGFGDIELTGAIGYSTPNIDKMAGSGIFFSHYYSPQAVCSASRAGLLTGCYPNRVGFHGALDHTAKTGINADEETIAEVLKKKGYSTAAFGKWHLGHSKQFLPTHNGFDEYFGIPYSNDMWPNHPKNKNYYPPLPLIEGDEAAETNPDQSKFTTEFTE
jgi:arylsulfatase